MGTTLTTIAPQCWILALFIRDDGERFLLGDGAYIFTQKQQHFSADNLVNDTVEIQGGNGILLAGQVRRATKQSFKGYIGDGSTGKTSTETYRRTFINYFSDNHFYKVIYIAPDGTAICRKRGFLVSAPEVQELYQVQPEYNVELNFEDVNYYSYAEDANGDEIFALKTNTIKSVLSSSLTYSDISIQVILPVTTYEMTVAVADSTSIITIQKLNSAGVVEGNYTINGAFIEGDTLIISVNNGAVTATLNGSAVTLDTSSLLTLDPGINKITLGTTADEDATLEINYTGVVL